MKKALVLAVALVLVPAIGWTAFNCTPGKYSGKLVSVAKELDGTVGNAEITKEGDKCVVKFTAPAANEKWIISGNKLIQSEYDTAGKKVAEEYTATLKGNVYVIDCANATKNICSGNVDRRNTWQLENTPDGGLKYVVNGVGSDKKNDAAAVAQKRHEFVFKPVVAK